MCSIHLDLRYSLIGGQKRRGEFLSAWMEDEWLNEYTNKTINRFWNYNEMYGEIFDEDVDDDGDWCLGLEDHNYNEIDAFSPLDLFSM